MMAYMADLMDAHNRFLMASGESHDEVLIFQTILMIFFDMVFRSLLRSLLTHSDVMTDLGLTVSEKKLVTPSTCAVCLGIVVDTVEGTLSIPGEKLLYIKTGQVKLEAPAIIVWFFDLY